VRRRGPTLAAAARVAGELVDLVGPSPGLFRIGVRAGDLVQPGGVIGELEVLGQLVAITVPDGVRGAVVSAAGGGGLARPPVDFGGVLVTVDPRALADAATAAAAPAEHATTASAAAGRVFRAPTSGRFYGRPSPDQPPFVVAGDRLEPGATICLLEVMKTFHRVTFAGEPARVREVLIADGADVSAGDALLALE
jgi:acetyl-CoA carboxylase biotin carboxyl carrier protein